jgi:hypothetical protein
VTKRINCASPSYYDPVQGFSATNFSIPDMIDDTDDILKSLSDGSFALKGI